MSLHCFPPLRRVDACHGMSKPARPPPRGRILVPEDDNSSWLNCSSLCSSADDISQDVQQESQNQSATAFSFNIGGSTYVVRTRNTFLCVAMVSSLTSDQQSIHSAPDRLENSMQPISASTALPDIGRDQQQTDTSMLRSTSTLPSGIDQHGTKWCIFLTMGLCINLFYVVVLMAARGKQLGAVNADHECPNQSCFCRFNGINESSHGCYVGRVWLPHGHEYANTVCTCFVFGGFVAIGATAVPLRHCTRNPLSTCIGFVVLARLAWVIGSTGDGRNLPLRVLIILYISGNAGLYAASMMLLTIVISVDMSPSIALQTNGLGTTLCYALLITFVGQSFVVFAASSSYLASAQGDTMLYFGYILAGLICSMISHLSASNSVVWRREAKRDIWRLVVLHATWTAIVSVWMVIGGCVCCSTIDSDYSMLFVVFVRSCEMLKLFLLHKVSKHHSFALAQPLLSGFQDNK